MCSLAIFAISDSVFLFQMEDFFRTHELGAGRNAADLALENIQIAIFVKENMYPGLVTSLLQQTAQ